MRIYFIVFCFLIAALFTTQSVSAQAVQGNDFWFMLPSNSDNGGVCSSNYRLILVSQFCVENEIELSAPSLGFSKTYSIESGEYFEIDLSQLEGIAPTDIVTPTPRFADGAFTDVSFHLTSPQPVQAFLYVDRALSAEGETLLPTKLLGTEYVPALRGFQVSEIETHIVATEDNTSVDIDGFGIVGQQNINLDKGEIFSFFTELSCDGDLTFNGNCVTMDGTVIRSDKKVAIFASNTIAQMGSAGNGDMIMQTFLPVNNWSNEYITGQNIERKTLVGNNIARMNGAGDYLQITGAIGTTITIEYNNNPARVEVIASPTWGNYGYGYVFLDLEEMGAYFGDANTFITADGPIQVCQYTKGSFSDSFAGSFEATKADPEALLVLPNSFWESSYIFYQISSREDLGCFGQISDFAELQTLVIILDDVPVGGVLPSESIELNGTNVGAGGWIPFSTGSTKKIKRIIYGNTESTTVVSTIDAKFGINFYGSRERHSAIFSGGYGPIEDVNLCDQCADFDISQNASACINDTVPFSPVIYSFSQPNSLKFDWDFGDGTTSKLRDPKKVYTSTGVYNVVLTISDNKSDCKLEYSKVVYVNKAKTEIVLDHAQDGIICSFDSIFTVSIDSLLPEGEQRVQITNTDSTAIPDGLSNTNGIDSSFIRTNGAYANSLINISGNYPAGAYVDSICLNVQHPRVDELHGYLITPWGARYDLFFDLSTNGRGNMRKTCFSPSGVVQMDVEQPPYTGTFVEYAAGLNGISMWPDITSKAPTGVWSLNIGDDQEFNSGFIDDWSIYVNTENGVKTYNWEPKNLLVKDTNLSNVIFNPPADTGYFTITSTIETFNGCFANDSIELYRDRDPIVFPQIDTVLCNTADSLNLDTLFSKTFKDFRLGGTFTLLGSDPNSVFFNNTFHPAIATSRVYFIRYLYDFQCGTDTATIAITLNELPILGADSSISICGTETVIDLNDYLVNDDKNKGKWSSVPSLDNSQLDTILGEFYPTNIAPGVYNTTYSVSLSACATQSVNVNVDVVRQLSPGLDNDTILCEKASGLNVLDLLKGSPDDGGTWTEANFGATVSGNVFDLRDRSNSGITTYNFTYAHTNQTPCLDTTAELVVQISNAPTAQLIPDFPIVCRDSTVNITVNIQGESPAVGYSLKVSDGSTIYPDVNTNVMSGTTFPVTLSSTTTFRVTELIDNSALACPFYEDITLEMRVFDQLIVDLIEERCKGDFSAFTPIIEISGGDTTGYVYDLYVNGLLVKKDELVTSLPLSQDTIPNGSIYEYRFTDLSNCEDSRTSFVREPAKYCECVTFPGNMDRTPLDLCEDVTAVTAETKNSFIETIPGSEDTLFYILHNTAGIIEGTVYDTNTAPEFNFIPGVLQYNTEYYISAIAGDKIPGFGYVDPLDTCIAVNRGTPVIWRQKPELSSLTPAATVCFGETATISYEAIGKAPFTLSGQYQIGTGPLVDTSFTLANNKGDVYFTLPESRTFFINKIVDANATTVNLTGGQFCSNPVSAAFTINVNPLPEIMFADAGPLIGCEGDVVMATFTLSGQQPFNFSYKYFGAIRQEINYASNSFSVNVTQSGLIELLGISDLTGCAGTIEGNKILQTEIRKKPIANVLTQPLEVCGNQVALEADPSFGTGLWTAEIGGGLANPVAPKTTGFANYSDTALTFVWTESNPPCEASKDSVEIYFRLDPAPFAGLNDTICGLTYKLKAEASIPASRGSRSWIQIAGDQAIFDDSNDPNATVTVPNNGFYKFVYLESVDGICVNSDTLELTFVAAPQIVIVDTICDAISQNFTIRYDIISNLKNDLVTNGTPFGNIYQIKGVSGGSVTITASLNAACKPSSEVTIAYECPCITDISGFRSDTVRVCFNEVYSFADAPIATLDANDTLLYILKESADASNLNDVVYTSRSNKYIFNIPNIDFNKVYYAMAIAGNADVTNTVGIDFNDRCRVATLPVPVLIQKDYTLFFPSNLYFCEGEPQTMEVFGIPDNVNIDVTVSVDGSLSTFTVSKALPFITFNSPVGKSYIEVGTLVPDDGFACAKKNVQLIEVNVNKNPTINFDLDQAVCVGESTVLQLNSAINNFEIIVNGIDTLRNKTNVYTYTTPGVSTVKVALLGDFGCESVKTFNVNVQDIPVPDFQTAPTVCFPGPISARVLGTNPNVVSRKWKVNGKLEPGNLLLSYVPLSSGSYTIVLEEITSNGCVGTTIKNVLVSSPRADFTLGGDSICSSENLKLQFANTNDVEAFTWNYSGYLNGNSSNNTVILDLSAGDQSNPLLIVKLRIFDSFGCSVELTDTVKVNYTKANFGLNDPLYCLNDNLSTSNFSINASEFEWEVGNLGTFRRFELSNIPLRKLDSTLVTLIAKNPITGCSDKVQQNVFVNALPVLTSLIDTVCKNLPTVIRVAGADDYAWSPGIGLDNPFGPSPTIITTVDRQYTVTGIFANGCSNTLVVNVPVYDVTPPPFQSYIENLGIGDTISVNISNENNYNIYWLDELGDTICVGCTDSLFQVFENVNLTVISEDKYGCFSQETPIVFTVNEMYALDFPDAFTPNNDGINDFIQPEGLGIKEYISVQFFNREGDLVFNGKDDFIAWDGTYNGKKQPLGTYTFKVVARFYRNDQVKIITGTFSLLR